MNKEFFGGILTGVAFCLLLLFIMSSFVSPPTFIISSKSGEVIIPPEQYSICKKVGEK
jgi:hypothetical protein